VLDLGNQPLANNLLSDRDLEKHEPRFSLRLLVCTDCWLLQIADVVPPVELFSEYLYFSSFSDTMLAHARQAAERYCTEFGLTEQSFVAEIASNDGYLLQNFQQRGVPCLGVEPAANVARAAVAKGIETRVEFFTAALAEELAGSGRQADLILGNNVFAHVPDTNDFVSGLKKLLKPGGRIVLEFPYAVECIERCEFDTIYHEHVFYFSLTPLRPLFARHGLVICDVERIPVHGGSLRLFAAHAGEQVEGESVAALLAFERGREVDAFSFYGGFAERVRALKAELTELLTSLKEGGSSVAAYGASAKGSTLLNYIGVGRDVISFMVDRSPHKQGFFSPGRHIPIAAPAKLLEERPDYALLLTWNFAAEILEQQSEYRERGGKFIIPIPSVKVV